jgi:hypothetical protein
MEIGVCKSLIQDRSITLLEQAFKTDKTLYTPLEHAITLEKIIREIFKESDYIDLIIKFAIHLSRVTYIGFYSIQINEKLRFGDSVPESLFPELFENSLLSDEEKSTLIDEYQLEQQVLKDAFLKSLISKSHEIQFFPTFSDLELGIPLDDLYSISSYLQKTKIRQPPYQIQYLLDEGAIIQVPIWDLLTNYSKYSIYTIHRIKVKFSIELKLLKKNPNLTFPAK